MLTQVRREAAYWRDLLRRIDGPGSGRGPARPVTSATTGRAAPLAVPIGGALVSMRCASSLAAYSRSRRPASPSASALAPRATRRMRPASGSTVQGRCRRTRRAEPRARASRAAICRRAGRWSAAAPPELSLRLRRPRRHPQAPGPGERPGASAHPSSCRPCAPASLCPLPSVALDLAIESPRQPAARHSGGNLGGQALARGAPAGIPSGPDNDPRGDHAGEARRADVQGGHHPLPAPAAGSDVERRPDEPTRDRGVRSDRRRTPTASDERRDDELPVHQVDLQSAIGSIRDTLVTIAFDEELPAEGMVAFLKALS